MNDKKQILILEDQVLISVDIVGMIEESGHTVLGPYDDTMAAQRALETNRPDAVILDVKLKDGLVWPVSDRLVSQNIPLIFATGYDKSEILARYPSVTCFEKPFAAEDIVEHLNSVVLGPAE